MHGRTESLQVQIITRQTLLWTCVAGAHLQCVNNRYAKFEYKNLFKLQLTHTLHYVSTLQVV